ncbi:class I SAM-dependent DNA methyltransferase [Cryptosporangium sp. NPDC048952]|uniref:class I SAM-dependent DNA methyltransferase n=1 Tax=Cryptosporangium sp. NPDC048952 TaxID=3363961 RepID=UPI00371825B4
MTSSDLWDQDAAEHYEETSAAMYAPEVLDPAVDFLARLAGSGAALEFAVGTGRVAIPLAARGVPVTGIELSRAMADQLRRRDDQETVPVVLGDMATTATDGRFTLVYLVWNGLSNLRTQDEQVRCFANAARHLTPGGRFVIELWVPGIQRMPPGQSAVPFEVSAEHTGFDTYDLVTQRGTSHHYWRQEDGSLRYGASNFRYVWPSECDLMARLAGLELEQRLADWKGAPYTASSESHVSVWQKPSDVLPGNLPA